ncbi:MAG: hypothetical protein AAGB07_11335 [Pseudomonadota bacterium]
MKHARCGLAATTHSRIKKPMPDPQITIVRPQNAFGAVENPLEIWIRYCEGGAKILSVVDHRGIGGAADHVVAVNGRHQNGVGAVAIDLGKSLLIGHIAVIAVRPTAKHF